MQAVMPKSYDKLSLDYGMVLDLRFLEGTGLITRDIARPHHEVDLVGPPAWVQTERGLTVLQFAGLPYLECPAAETVDLDFTTEDYSIAVWTYHTASVLSDIVVGRYGVNLDGWEFYLGASALQNLNLRHSHQSLGPGDLSDSCYSEGWLDDVWNLAGVSRGSLYPQMYRNALPVEMTYEAGGVKDPDTCNRDLVIGVRYTKNTNWYHGNMWGLRIWNRALSLFDWQLLFSMERHLFGV